MNQIQTEIDKNTKKSFFKNFYAILCTFRKIWWRRMLKTFKKEPISCRGGFFEEVKAISVEKMNQIRTEIDKILENSDF